MKSRRRALLVVPLLLSPALAACSDDAGGAEPTRPAEPVDDIAAAAAQCTAVLNERDEAVFRAGQDAGFELLTLSLKDEAPSAAERSELVDAMSAVRDLLQADRDRLADASALDGWEDLLAPLDETIEVLGSRVEGLESGRWPLSKDELSLGAPFASADRDAAEASGLAGRDCEVLAAVAGPAAEAEELVRAASVACGTIVDRRRTSGYDDAATTSLEVVLAVRQGDDLDVTDAMVGDLRALRDEWQATYDDLAAVPADGVADAGIAEAWASDLQLAEDRARLYGERLAALESGERARIDEEFQTTKIGVPGWDWEGVGLQSRDCRSVRA
ncbi:hypothetical protein [Nocardioides humi]|uniref:Imelysin n=1 Tax=Nocardioides humi TaxID=449461 RepID=A0ABN1ZVP2_9ACTN|nr:hypothetical protein [Nocardioides humi]